MMKWCNHNDVFIEYKDSKTYTNPFELNVLKQIK